MSLKLAVFVVKSYDFWKNARKVILDNFKNAFVYINNVDDDAEKSKTVFMDKGMNSDKIMITEKNKLSSEKRSIA